MNMRNTMNTPQRTPPWELALNAALLLLGTMLVLGILIPSRCLFASIVVHAQAMEAGTDKAVTGAQVTLTIDDIDVNTSVTGKDGRARAYHSLGRFSNISVRCEADGYQTTFVPIVLDADVSPKHHAPDVQIKMARLSGIRQPHSR
jgi:hypothetical protein